jgi:hypothetical protein
MLFLDGVYIDGATETAARFRWVMAPTSEELTRLVQRIARRVGRFLERQGLLERDAENSYLDAQVMNEGPMNQLRGHSITYRIAVGPQAGRKVFSLQTLPASDPQEALTETVGKVAGFSLHAGVAARRMNARSWSGCAATSAVRRFRKDGSRSPRTVTSATS